jgi:transglutaminase-like putative cysteine protease
MADARNREPLPLHPMLALLAGCLLAAAPHAPRLPWWVTLLAAAMLGWRAWAQWKNEILPRRWLLLVLVVVGLGGVYLTYRTIFGRDAGVTLLVMFLALKLLETRAHRDAVVVTFLCYFLALTNFFYSQSVMTAVLMLATVLILTASLVAFNGTRRRLSESARVATTLIAQGVPVMVILFFLFPRVSGPLWGLPADAFSGTTGLSDSMTPGNISLLSQSDAIAFRVQFDGPAPDRRRLYWRGPVFWHFDGRTWRAGDVHVSEVPEFEPRGQPHFYAVTLEPHERNWLFALDMPAKVPPGAAATGDFQLHARLPVRNRVRYETSSFLDYRATSGATPNELDAARQVPDDFNPRAVRLAESWRREAVTNERVVERAIEYFKRANLQYTLAPPPLGRDSVDEFLFETKSGFCEHFSSAFAFMMRAAGVPARVVTGYQGGELNPIDGYVVVRQSDAHAWVEVWTARDGWLRVDPTAVAVPIRVEAGLAAAVPRTHPLPLLGRVELNWLRALRFNWEALANYWNQWVVGYNTERQRDLLSRLGMPSPSWEKMAMALFWLVGLVVAVFSLWLLRRAHGEDPVTAAWRRFCRKLARRGTARRPSEGPHAFAARAALEQPHVAADVAEIGGLYVNVRYGRDPDPTLVGLLRQRVRELKV